MTTTIDTHQIYRLRPGWRLQWEEVQQRHVLLYPEGMVKLNESAGAILSQIDGQRNVDQMIERLQAQFPQAPDRAIAEDVNAFLAEALEQGWVHHD